MKRAVLIVCFVAITLGGSLANSQAKTDLERDELKGRVKSVTVERVTFSESFGKWIESERVMESEESYQDDGSAKDTTNYADGKASIWIVYSHDDAGLLTGADWSDSIGNMVARETYIHDASGNLTEFTHYNSDGSFDYKAVFTFDNSHNATSYTTYSGDGQLTGRGIYRYDKKNSTIEMAEYDAKGSLSGKSVRKFDLKHELSETYLGPDGSVTWTKTFEYDVAGNWIKSTVANRVSKFGKTYDEPSTAEYRTIAFYE